ncbi:MAG: hypothetical protein IAE89_02195 [Anaerolineae bacterium]|nr:hypothetical protein [Anaerolineae bacterium]
MSEKMLMLVLSDENRFSELQAAAHNTELVYADDMMSALGQYIVSMPQVILIDSTHPDAEAAVIHLRSVDARPILVLVDECAPAAWLMARGFMDDYAIHTMSVSLPPGKVMASARKDGERAPAFAYEHRLIS